MSRRTICGSCDSIDLLPVLDLGSSPLADRFPTMVSQVETFYRLDLLLCLTCLLVQLGEVVPDDELWDDYAFYSGTSPALGKYHEQFVEDLKRRTGAHEPRLTLEIACNDGSLLSLLPGKRVVGIDGAAGPVAVGREQGLDIRLGLFNIESAHHLRDELGPADLIVAQNVMAHVRDLPGFCAGIAHMLSDDGIAIIEVQALENLLLGNQFDHVYHEHRFFFSSRSVTRTLAQSLLSVVSVERTPMQGGSLRVTVRKGPRSDEFKRPQEGWRLVSNLATYTGLQARADYLRDRLLDLLDQQMRMGSVAGYAASAKSTTLLNWCGITSLHVPYVVDTTPHKIGKFTPGSKIEVVAPGQRPDPDTYLLLAHNYLSRTRQEPFSGDWLVPIPQPVII